MHCTTKLSKNLYSVVFLKKKKLFVLTPFTPFSHRHVKMCTNHVFVSAGGPYPYTLKLCFSTAQHANWAAAASPITSPSCYFIVLYGSFVRVGVQTCRVNLMLIEPQHMLRVKLTELIVFNGRGELKRFCTSILVLLPFLFFFFFIAYYGRLLALCSAPHF